MKILQKHSNFQQQITKAPTQPCSLEACNAANKISAAVEEILTNTTITSKHKIALLLCTKQLSFLSSISAFVSTTVQAAGKYHRKKLQEQKNNC